MKFNKTKCNVLHLDQGNPLYQYRPGYEQIESSPTEKDLGVLVNKRLDMTWQCALADQKASCVLAFIKGSMATPETKQKVIKTGNVTGKYLIAISRIFSHSYTFLNHSNLNYNLTTGMTLVAHVQFVIYSLKFHIRTAACPIVPHDMFMELTIAN
ncbi:hypothetical protein BTVI_54816 [Pitangus sulphuratus]|nr:hypothetical protein BTVI_54816 [Pitangus sulphuratus]